MSFSLLPELGHDPAADVHALEGLVGDVDVIADGLQALLGVVKLLCKRKKNTIICPGLVKAPFTHLPGRPVR